MKKTIKNMVRLLVSGILLFTTVIPAQAANPNVTYTGQAEKFIFTPGTEYSPTDLFPDFKDLMPGDTVKETITVSNMAGDCDYVKIYLRAQAHDEEGNPLSYDEAYEAADGNDQSGIAGERDETPATMADFLAQLSMKVYDNERTFLDASAADLGGLSENVLLGILHAGESATLTVELEVPIELGNEYMSRVGEVDWVFTVETFDEEPTPTPTPEDGRGSETQTGDNLHFGLYIVLFLMSGVVLLFQKTTQKTVKRFDRGDQWDEEN
ncbi:MAG: sortase B protein-sorting domain-containing protein [Lachnospiraceae bacterium]|nr:sortase B protein-sorting domain-containing protein [Lachnospiraceae bacterium]